MKRELEVLEVLYWLNFFLFVWCDNKRRLFRKYGCRCWFPGCSRGDYPCAIWRNTRRDNATLFIESSFCFCSGSSNRLCTIKLKLFALCTALGGDLFGCESCASEELRCSSSTRERHTLALHLSRIDLSRQPAGLTPGEVSFSKEPALP